MNLKKIRKGKKEIYVIRKSYTARQKKSPKDLLEDLKNNKY